jgi:hypothetical protein
MTKANTELMDGGFSHHGVATPISNHRGTVATVDGDGRNVVLVWLFDHRGGYAILVIDAETGDSQEVPMPFPPGGDCPYASVLSSRNRFYTHFNSYFCEFDPAKREFTFSSETANQMAMSMTEADDGRIWSPTYPNSGIVSYDPGSGTFRDYGHLYEQNWRQYPRSVATDDTGWVYFAIGSTSGQVISLDPDSGESTPVFAEEERVQGSGAVYRDVNGKVYGTPHSGDDERWVELYRGGRTDLGRHDNRSPKPEIADSQGLFHQEFPDGKRLEACDLVERELVVSDPESGTESKVSFDYSSEGAHLMGLAAAPDDTICGGTAFPMRFFRYDPKEDEWTNRAAYGQCNTVVSQGDRFFVGGYGGGFLLEWDPASEWVHTEMDRADCNPVFHTQVTPAIHRPHDLLAHPDGKTIILAGTPGYGYTGGGLLFWDRETRSQTLVEHMEILPEHSTMSLVALSEGKLLGGSTTGAGTGGEQKAKEAELYVMDMTTKVVEWHEVLFPGAQVYTDMCNGPGGVVYGFVDRKRFFVFDPDARKVIHECGTESTFGVTTSQQGPRVFVKGPDGAIYVLFVKGIARVNAETYDIEMITESPVPIQAGGDYLDGRIYFSSGSHVYSYEVSG